MRLFIAFEIPALYDHFLTKSQEAILAKASFPKSFHLTLKFIGEVEEEKLNQLIKNLEQVKFDPFDMNFSGVGCFPDDKKARIVWFALEPKDKIAEVQSLIEDATKDFGIPQKKEFIPHITVARIKYIEDRDKFCNTLDTINIPTDTFKVTEFKLIKSTLTPEGPKYEALKSFQANN